MVRWSAGNGQTRRSLLARAVAGAASVTTIFATAGPAFADETWCDLDPPVNVRTPSGRNRVVFVTDSGPEEYRRQLQSAEISYSVSPAGQGTATDVRLSVTVSDVDGKHQAMRSEVWTGPNRTGTLLSGQDGTMGKTITHNFRLDIP
jgi:hypothetical protein